MNLIFKDSIYYLIAIYGSRLFSFIFKIGIARILGPRDYGLWNALSLILLYGNFLHLGLCFALVKEVPFYRGKEKWHEIEEIRNTVFTSVIMISSIAGITLFSLLTFFAKYSNDLFAVFALISVILVLQQIKNYFLYYFIAEKNFRAVSLLIICLAFLTGIIGLSLVIKFSFIGLPLGISLGYLLVLFYIFNKFRPELKLHMNIKMLLRLFRIGFPIMLVAISYVVFFTVDRVLIFKYIGRENLGYYGIASALNGFLVLLPMSLGGVLFPRLSEKYGATGKPKELKEVINLPTIMISYVMSAILGLIYLFLPTVVKIVIPQYILGVDTGRIALIGIMFFSVSVFTQKFLIAINRQILCLFIVLSALVLKIALIYIFIKNHLGIAGVAIAVNITYFIFSTFVIMLASYYYKNNFLESAKYFIKIYLPFIYLLLILFISDYLKQIHILNMGNEIIYISVNSIILIILVIVPFGYVIRKDLFAYSNLYIFRDRK